MKLDLLNQQFFSKSGLIAFHILARVSEGMQRLLPLFDQVLFQYLVTDLALVRGDEILACYFLLYCLHRVYALNLKSLLSN